MRNFIGRTYFYLLLIGCVLAVSCRKEGKIIPKGKMSEIYADMFVADQWLSQNYRAARVADTTFVYEAVFSKYGYDMDDYRASVDHYIEDPERFARILRKTITILDDRIAEQKQDLKEQKSLEAGKPTSPVSFDFDRIWIFEKGYPRLVPRDSLDFFRDRSEYFILDLKTLFEPVVYDSSVYFPQKPEDAAKDTSAVRDTVKTSDENK